MTEQTTSETAEEAVTVRGRVAERTRYGRKLPRPGRVKRYILTSAQNNTHVHEDVWLNVMAMAAHYDAEIIVGTFSYQKAAYGNKAVKRGTKRHDDADELWYDPQITEHIVDEPVQLAPGLVWCGEMNILPTSPDPLAELEAYNGSASNIFPHAKFAMQSIASMGNQSGAKLNYTTGTVTQRNYLQKKAGLKAERDHGYGALLVEVNASGHWWVRQLEAAASDGWSIRDFTLKAEHGEVTDGHPVEACHWGDIHQWLIDPIVEQACWGRKTSMMEVLRPRYQFMHDLIDQRARNHHEQKNPLLLYKKWRDGRESVQEEIRDAAEFLVKTSRDYCKTIVVPSNHHEAIERWLREADWRTDPVNARFYHEAWLALLYHEDDAGEFDVFEWACRVAGCPPPERCQFLTVREGFLLCPDAEDGGIEAGMHGHLGLDGARGSLKGFARMGRRSNIGHGHSAGIYRGIFMAGVCQLTMGYARGPSSWTVSHIVTYPEGTRQMVTMYKGKWRA